VPDRPIPLLLLLPTAARPFPLASPARPPSSSVDPPWDRDRVVPAQPCGQRTSAPAPRDPVHPRRGRAPHVTLPHPRARSGPSRALSLVLCGFAATWVFLADPAAAPDLLQRLRLPPALPPVPRSSAPVLGAIVSSQRP
jgi:hypothetical protein